VRGNRLPKIRFRLLQRETQLEKRRLRRHGDRRSPSSRNVRAQDIVDYSFSVRGREPGLQEQVRAGTYQLNAVTPTRVRACGSNIRASARLHFKPPAPSVSRR